MLRARPLATAPIPRAPVGILTFAAEAVKAAGDDSGMAVQAHGRLRDAPGPPPWRAWRDVLAWSRDQVRPVQRLAAEYGDIALLRCGPLRFYFVQHPDLIQECLVTRHKAFKKDHFFVNFVRIILGNGVLTAEGDFHLKQRRMLQPAFYKDRIQSYAESMIQCADALESGWQDGQRINITEEMMQLTLAIVGKTLFNSDVSSDARAVAAAIETILERGDLFLIPLFPRILDLPLARNRKFFGAINDLDTVLYRLIKEHREAGDQGDLLSMLLAAQDDEDNTRMDDKQVRDEALTLFTAGHETTSLALTWLWYLVGQHPEVEARLHEEVDRVLAGRLPTPADYPQLAYTQRVFQEAIRLYPPTIMVGREALEDTTLGDYAIPKGGIVVMTPYVTHRLPEFYESPDTFEPDRWLPEAAAKQHKHAFIPFGGGQRRCIGEGFAWMEAVLSVATLARHWRIQLDPTHEIDLRPNLTMRPRGGIPATLHRR